MINIIRFKNNLSLIKTSLNNSSSVIVSILIKVGSRDEKNNLQGISHFIEHMVFKGTKKYSKNELNKKIDNFAGSFNAFTSCDFTCFYFHTVSEEALKAFKLLKEMIFESIFPEKEIEIEKSVILEEIKLYQEDLNDLVIEIFNENLFKNTFLENKILGTQDTMLSLNKEKILNFFKKYYIAEKMIINIAGNIKIINNIEKYINNTIALLPKNIGFESKINNIININNIKPFGFKCVIKQDIKQIYFVFGCMTVGKKHSDYYMLKLLSIILGGGLSSYLNLKIREELGLCYEIGCFQNSYHEVGQFLITGVTSFDKFSELLVSIECIFKQIKRNKISIKDLRLAKKQLINNIILNNESIINKFNLGTQLIYNDFIISLSEQKKLIKNINLSKINKCFNKYINRGIFNLCIIGPSKIKNFEKNWREVKW